MIENGRTIEKFVIDYEKTKNMTAEEKREYYRKLFAEAERERLRVERGV